MMDWYFGHDVGDLVVPKDQEYFDRLPSPDSWSQWGSGGFGNLGWPNNFNNAADKLVNNMPGERTQHCMSFGRANNEMSQTEGECSLANSSVGGVSCEDFQPLQRNSAPRAGPDYHFNHLMEDDNTMDDIFMSSLLQDDFAVAAAHNHTQLGVPSQSQCIGMADDSDSANMMMDFHSISSDTDGAGNIGYGNSSGLSNGSSVKASETMDMLPSDPRRCEDEDSSIEESVLLGLEAVLKQLNDSTRLCFRDSLYRLAQRSKHQLSVEDQVDGLSLDKPTMLQTGNEQIRSARTGTAESETNTIDRAVANLMFNKVNVSMQDQNPSASVKCEHRGTTSLAGSNYGSNQQDSYIVSRPTNLQADSEVPVFRQQYPNNPSRLPSCAADGLF